MFNGNNNQSQRDIDFYKNAEKFWSDVPATTNGMLGGYACICTSDIQASEAFLRKLFAMNRKPQQLRALDCGAGIGRISQRLLTKHFKTVDLVEQNPKFVEESKLILRTQKNIGQFYQCGLQHFVPELKKYDVIWCQWVLGHLTDEDLVKFLQRCILALRENGVIVIKENISVNSVSMDEVDSSVTRTKEVFKQLFCEADLCVIKECKQLNFPKGLYNVEMFALRPDVSV